MTLFLLSENASEEIARLDALLADPDRRRFVSGSLRLALEPSHSTESAAELAASWIILDCLDHSAGLVEKPDSSPL